MSNSKFEFILNELRTVRDLGHTFHERAAQAREHISGIDFDDITEDQTELILIVAREIKRLC